MSFYIQAMRLKRAREGVVYVDPPHYGWIYEHIAKHENLKRRVPELLGDTRHEACTTGKISAWFTKMENELNPSQ